MTEDNKTLSPSDHVRGINPDQEKEIADRIRSAYDRGYNDARNASSVPGDNAASYRGRDMAAEITAELLAGLRRLTVSEVPEHRAAPSCQAVAWMRRADDGSAVVTAIPRVAEIWKEQGCAVDPLFQQDVKDVTYALL